MGTLIGAYLTQHIASLAKNAEDGTANRTHRFEFVCVRCQRTNDILVCRGTGRLARHTYACAGCRNELGKVLASAPPVVTGAAPITGTRRTGSTG